MELIVLGLFVALLSAIDASAQTKGVDLSLDRHLISSGDPDQDYSQLTCQASGNDVDIDSVTVIWVKVTGETTQLLTVTRTRPSDRVSSGGIFGNGTLKNNQGYIFLDQMDASICDSSYFLCEATFTEQSGEKGRTIATAWPRQSHNTEEASNDTHALTDLKAKVEHMSEALEMFNMSYQTLLVNRQREQLTQSKILSRVEKLEENITTLNGSQSCKVCSNLAQAVDNLENRLELLENSTMVNDDSNPTDQPKSGCYRGMNVTTNEQFVIVNDETLGVDIRCDAQTDGGGWIVIQRRVNGNTEFDRNWAAYRVGFGNLTENFWLGNKAIHTLTSQNSYELRLDFRIAGVDYSPVYETFKIEGENDKYRLRLGSVSSTIMDNGLGQDGFTYHNNSRFSTSTEDNDDSSIYDCGSLYPGGWWYKSCYRAKFNTPYISSGEIYNGWMVSKPPDFLFYSISQTEMKIRLLEA